MMVARAELYALLSEFADQEMETPLSPLAVAVYRRLAVELPEEFTEILQFELASRSQLVVNQNELTIKAIWQTHHPRITAAFWQLAREAIQQAFGIDIDTDDLELLPESDIRKALYECL
jgi:hypothetical protein